MKLVLAEKPSVAQSIAKVLGAAKREDGYLEGNGYVVSWCVGHLVELAQPEVYDAKYSKWAYADLPIFPMDWQYEVSAGTKKQFGILKKLMAREDVASLVCATDAGREGELIFRLVYHKAGCRKPFERLWISSMEDVAIKEGFENLRSGTEYDALYEAALCRERADWIVGINATRLFSTLYGQTLNVGRVMTPTLAMAVMREAAISAFKPELFYTSSFVNHFECSYLLLKLGYMYQAIELQVFDVAHHSEIHNKNLPAQPGQDYCNSYEWYHLTLGFVKAHPKTFLTQYFDEHLGCAKLALECFLSTIPLDHSVSKILPGSQVLGH